MAGKYMYGVGSLSFKGQVLGLIRKDSFQMNPTKGESSKVWAEQKQAAPAKTLPGSNGTIAPSFNLIEIDYDAMQSILGGTVKKNAANKTIGWRAPSEVITIEGEFVIETVSGHRITIFNGLLLGAIGGGLNMTDVSQIEVSIEVQLPEGAEGDAASPYEIEDIEEPANNPGSGDGI